METIYKFEFEIKDSFKLMLSPDCNTVKVDLQNEVPCAWILVDSENMTKETEFRIFGTGHPIDIDGFFHAGTFYQGYFVWHLFQEH